MSLDNPSSFEYAGCRRHLRRLANPSIRRVLEIGGSPHSSLLLACRDVFPTVEHLVVVGDDPAWREVTLDGCREDNRVIFRDDIQRLTDFDFVFIGPYGQKTERANILRSASRASVFLYSPVDPRSDWPIQRFRPSDSVSVVMASYRRASLLRLTLERYAMQTRLPDEIIIVEDGTCDDQTRTVCDDFREQLPIRYFNRRDRPQFGWSNPAVPRNIGIRCAKGDIVVLQDPEVRFVQPADLENIVRPLLNGTAHSCCAPCEALDDNGRHQCWYADPRMAGNFMPACQAYLRSDLTAIGGFDEGFIGYGKEDNDLAWRYLHTGAKITWAENVVVQHQWHPPAAYPESADHSRVNHKRAADAIRDILACRRGIAANAGREWGRLV